MFHERQMLTDGSQYVCRNKIEENQVTGLCLYI